MEKLRNSMIELASSKLGHPLSAEEINHIEHHLRTSIFSCFSDPKSPILFRDDIWSHESIE
ncbi:hypothetical protein JHK82_025452 [Glycine max]|uniref:Uncharacterized protein n=2 Tax=Glycine subgen. Soja TaxID=1462606 RepID=A0A0R0I9V2_SOYBN|nr:hypothetical protein JHK85_026074 [Glycine max]KAG5134264.1 hypothetical protein JHK82_025452 [Glycine max]KAH1043516.1 hypothetical protein GYH30_025384 [Glycine max]KRH39094.1 hypothetical protein GLYMA_09G177400v4 [Glycine max]RZB92545.1 hypothetical protein D0Y65_024491 [Glycine soja]